MRVCLDLASGTQPRVYARLPALATEIGTVPPGDTITIPAQYPRAVVLAPLQARVSEVVRLPGLPNVVLTPKAIPQVSAVVGIPGPPGPPGELGEQVVQRVAAVALGGNRVVKPVADGQVNYATSDFVPDANIILGITQGAAIQGDIIDVQIGGTMEEPSWNWTIGQVFCGLNGVLTQTPPTTGFLCRVGRAIAPTTIVISVEEAILLA